MAIEDIIASLTLAKQRERLALTDQGASTDRLNTALARYGALRRQDAEIALRDKHLQMEAKKLKDASDVARVAALSYAAGKNREAFDPGDANRPGMSPMEYSRGLGDATPEPKDIGIPNTTGGIWQDMVEKAGLKWDDAMLDMSAGDLQNLISNRGETFTPYQRYQMGRDAAADEAAYGKRVEAADLAAATSSAQRILDKVLEQSGGKLDRASVARVANLVRERPGLGDPVAQEFSRLAAPVLDDIRSEASGGRAAASLKLREDLAAESRRRWDIANQARAKGDTASERIQIGSAISASKTELDSIAPEAFGVRMVQDPKDAPRVTELLRRIKEGNDRLAEISGIINKDAPAPKAPAPDSRNKQEWADYYKSLPEGEEKNRVWDIIQNWGDK